MPKISGIPPSSWKIHHEHRSGPKISEEDNPGRPKISEGDDPGCPKPVASVLIPNHPSKTEFMIRDNAMAVKTT